MQESQNLPVFRVIDRYWGGDKEKREFRLPDLRGRFVRGVNHDQSQYGDPEASIRHPSADGGAAKNHVGSIQNQSFRKHRHRLNDPGHAHDVHLGKGDKNNEMAADGDHFIPRRPDMHLGTYSSLTNISMDDAGGVETRPVNVYVNWIIKLGPPQTGTAPRNRGDLSLSPEGDRPRLPQSPASKRCGRLPTGRPCRISARGGPALREGRQ